MAGILEESHCAQMNELRTANSRALDEFMRYVASGETDEIRYAALLADAQRTWSDFNDCARKFKRQFRRRQVLRLVGIVILVVGLCTAACLWPADFFASGQPQIGLHGFIAIFAAIGSVLMAVLLWTT